MYCALFNNNFATGQTISEALACFVKWHIDFESGTLYIDGQRDTISYSKEFSENEMRREAFSRVLEIMKRRGLVLFKEI